MLGETGRCSELGEHVSVQLCSDSPGMLGVLSVELGGASEIFGGLRFIIRNTSVFVFMVLG